MDFDKMVTASRLRLRKRSPYFATLSMYADIVPSDDVPVAATDGERIYLNPEKYGSYSAEYRESVFLHEILHAALLHVPRMGRRSRALWNIAADIVVNGMITELGLAIPRGGIREPDLEEYPVEEVYQILLREGREKDLSDRHTDLRPELGASEDAGSGTSGGDGSSDAPSESRRIEKARAHWKRALDRARAAAPKDAQGSEGLGFEREFDQIRDPQLNWRHLLWRYLAQTPNDFQGFDRRFVSRGIYLDTLEGQSLTVYVAVDTSGSIDRDRLTDFVSELEGILRSYPHIDAYLYYADADIYGPHELTPDASLPEPEGGGGTDFRPFFDEVESQGHIMESAVAVYLTDGHGTFPDQKPRIPVVWAISPGGLPNDDIPFGKKLRLGV